MGNRLPYDENELEECFSLHANSVNALQAALVHGPARDLPCAKTVDGIIHHLQCEIYILRDEIERLKENKND